MTDNSERAHETFLVLRCQTGDREAFDELLRSIQTKLRRYIGDLAGEDLADDILQNVFLIIYRKIGWLNSPDLFRPWVYRIATRETFRVLKKRSRWREEVLDDGVADTVPARTSAGELDPAMLDKVSPASRAVLMLHYLEDLSINETADVLDISVGTVKSRLAYGLKILRSQIDREETT